MDATYEVEQKFIVADLEALRARVEAAGIAFGEPVLQIDRYFNHPQRDFAETDEAFRIRVDGEQNRITYKGPKIDLTTKTRQEIELSIASGSETQEAMAAMLRALSFREVATVQKTRRYATIPHDKWQVELTLDDVNEVGTFAELEIVVQTDQLDSARAALHEVAEIWKLGEVERRSYLRLLLELRDPPPT
jgi:adenylate cyclase class 2